MTVITLALIILTAIFVQVAIAILLWGSRRKQQYHVLNKEQHETEYISNTNTSSRSSYEPSVSDLAWNGFREFIAHRKEGEDVNNTICSFYLVPADGKPLSIFKPGQFLTFKLQIEDPNKHKQKSVVRCYSLSDAPRSGHYRVSIKLIPAPASLPDVPPGVSSGFFHDHVREGDQLLLKAPSGHFHLMEDSSLPIVLIGGGIGITPMLSILNTVLESGVSREMWLYYGVRNGDEHIMKEHLEALARTHDNFHLHICYSSPNENDVEGADYQHNSRVGIPLLRATLKLMRYQFYVCGPRPMMENLIPGLEEWGVDSDDIYYESFGPASLIKHKKVEPEATSTQPINVTFSQTGKSIPWDFAADSLLEFAEANDIDRDSGCRAGSCGSCQTAVNAGEVEYNQEPDADVMPGYCLLCICKPKNNLTLDA